MSTLFPSLDHSIETQDCLPKIVNSNGNLRRDCRVSDKIEHYFETSGVNQTQELLMR